jgi:hypothetical protein
MLLHGNDIDDDSDFLFDLPSSSDDEYDDNNHCDMNLSKWNQTFWIGFFVLAGSLLILDS